MKNKEAVSKQIEYHEGSTTWVPKNDVLTGEIDFQYNDSRGEPLIVIDGIEISWDEFAKTVLVYEGFKFKLEFIDPSNLRVDKKLH